MTNMIQTNGNRILLTVIMPCYNEAATLPAILERVRGIYIDKEIIAVDDCCADTTYAVLQAEAAHASHARDTKRT
jgi:glycosyltransferase involved in cell wall biosynthesis